MSVQPTGGTPTLRARPRARGTVRRVASAATTLAVVAALVLLGVHNGYPAQRPNLLFGAAWLSSTQVGQLTLLDGSSAEVVARVRTAPAGDKLDAVQEGATAYALDNLQERGVLFIGPGEQVYEGQVVAEHCRDNDLPIIVFNVQQAGHIQRAVRGEPVGTLICAGPIEVA